MKNLLSFIRVLLLSPVVVCSLLAQELPPIKNFSPSDYNGQNQNWSISQSDDRLIYVANNQGLLEYDGARWTTYPSPNETIMRSVKVIGDRIYTGCYMEFGFWEKDPFGSLNYSSISQRLKLEVIDDEEFWNIYGIENWIIFQSLNRIYIYDTQLDSVSIIESNDEIVKMYEANKSIYFQKIGKGIFIIKDGKEQIYLDERSFKSNEVVNLFAVKEGLLILTRNNGFFTYENGSLSPWTSANKNIADYSIYSAIRASTGNFVLGTISNGIIHLDERGNVIDKLDQSNGLANNTVLSIEEDLENNLWVGLDNGISLVNTNSPIKFYRDKNGTLGSVYSSAIHQGKLYLGTNQGLFFKELESKDDFSFVNQTQGQVWSLRVIDGTLFCGHHRGTFVVNGSRAALIATIPGTWDLKRLKEQDDLILQGNYDGLYALERINNSWRLRGKLEGFNNSSRHFETSGNNVFVNH